MATYKRSVTGVKRRPQPGNYNQESSLNNLRRKRQARARFARVFVLFLLIIIASIIGMFYYALKSDFCEEHFGINSPVTKFFKQMASDNSNKANAFRSLSFLMKREAFPLSGKNKKKLYIP